MADEARDGIGARHRLWASHFYIQGMYNLKQRGKESMDGESS